MLNTKTCLLGLFLIVKANYLVSTFSSSNRNKTRANEDISLLSSQPDVEIELDDERLIEVFKSNYNDKIIEEAKWNKYGQLKWYSYGSPKLIATNQSFLFPSQSGFYILVQMLSKEDRQLIADELFDKYEIRIKEKQIFNILSDKFICSFEVNCRNEQKYFVGFVQDHRKLPLRVEFKIENVRDKECLANISKTPTKELIVFSCKLTVLSSQQNLNIIPHSYKREFDAMFVRNFELIANTKILGYQNSSLMTSQKEIKNIVSMLNRLTQASSNQEKLVKNFTRKFHKIEREINYLNRNRKNKIIIQSNKTCNVEEMYLSQRLKGHSNYVMSLAMLPNGNVASGSADLNILIWNIDDGSLTRNLTGHNGWIRALTSSSSGHLISGSDDSTIINWDLNDDLEIRRFTANTEIVYALVFLPNGKLASGSSDNTTKIWNIDDGLIIKTLEGHTNHVTSLAVLSNGDLASGSADSTIIIWNINDGAIVKTLEGHLDSVRSLAALADGYLASGSFDKTIIIWNIDVGTIEKTLKGHASYVFSLAVLPNGHLASGSADTTIKIWNVNEGSLVKTLSNHTGWVNALISLPNGNLASASDDKTIIIWNTFCT